jgi:hypothetical protein
MDRTAQAEPLTTGQSIVAKWESPASPWSEPADLAEAIDRAVAAETATLRATILRFIDLAESYPDSPNDIRPQVSTLGRNALNLPGNPS